MALTGVDTHYWLQVLRGEEDLRELLDDDDEDEDFTLDWDELMGANPFGEGAPAPLADMAALSAGPTRQMCWCVVLLPAGP